MSVNKVILIGRVGKDPEVRSVGSDQVVNFSLATSEKYKNKSGEMVEKTEWHSIVLWRKLAELAAQYVHKGDMLYIEGKIQSRSYDKDGQKHYVTDIVGNEMRFLSSKGHVQSAPASTPAEPAEYTPVEVVDNDLPF